MERWWNKRKAVPFFLFLLRATVVGVSDIAPDGLMPEDILSMNNWDEQSVNRKQRTIKKYTKLNINQALIKIVCFYKINKVKLFLSIGTMNHVRLQNV